MDRTLPLTRSDIERAARLMIDDYGSDALAKAMDRAYELRREGYESVANMWYLICAAIDDHQT